MKNISLVFFLSLYATLSFSQTEKKHFLIGGSLTGSYDKHVAVPDGTWQNKVWNCGLYPRIGYFLANNVVCGIALTGSFAHIIQIHGDGTPNTTLKSYLKGAGFFGRYYLRKENDALIGELSYSYDSNRDVYESLDNSNPNEVLRIKYNGQNNVYSAGLGYTRFINEKVGLEIMARYRYRYDHAVDGHNNFAAESYSSGMSLGVGFQFYL